MGYRIIYSKRRRCLSGRTKRIIISLLICAALICVGYFCRPQLPEAALENMAEAVRDGETLSDAIAVFCREIIENAENFY